VRRTYAGQATWSDLTALRHELSQQAYVFVIDSLDFLDTKLADFLAPEVLAAAFTWTTRPAGGTWASWRSAAIRTIA
jgi:hypothetical protein